VVGNVDRVRVSMLVHTHGTRLVRLAHLLDVPEPELLAADAMAAILVRRGGGDAHQELMAAAYEVGARAEPPIHDQARLQGWLDRAELDPHQVDLMALQSATVQRMAVQRARRSTYRRRMGATAAAAVALVAGASALTGAEDDPPSPPSTLATGPSSGLRDAEDFVPASRVDLSPWLPPPPPTGLPQGQRAGRGIVVADAVLAGPSLPISTVHIGGDPATVLAVSCAPRDQPLSLCVFALPRDQTLREAESSSLLAVLPVPRGDRYTNPGSLSLSRSSIVDELKLKTVFMEATSADVGTVSVRFTTGDYGFATRFSAPEWAAALFVAVTGDATPAALTYLADGMTLDHRVLYTATP